MDYFDVLKKAWRITWRYKALWVLGLFAGVGSSGSSSGNSFNTGSDDFSSGGADPFTDWLTQNLALAVVVIGLLVLIGVIFWVLSVAAQGGLVYGANEAAEERTPSLKTAWGVGFKHWGRTFMIGLVLGLPALVLVLIAVTVGVALGVGGFALGEEAGGIAAAGGLCLLLPLFLVAIIALSIAIGIIYPLALRYGVLQDITFGEAIKRGWYDLRAKRGAFVFWLVMLLPGFAFSIAILLFMVPFLIPAVAFAIGEQYVIAVALFVVMALVTILPTAIYGTFVSSAWTVFFRKITGMETALDQGYVQPGAGGYLPPPVPPAYAPAAPPVYEPPAPPAPPSYDAPVPLAPPAPPSYDAPQVLPDDEKAPPSNE